MADDFDPCARCREYATRGVELFDVIMGGNRAAVYFLKDLAERQIEAVRAMPESDRQLAVALCKKDKCPHGHPIYDVPFFDEHYQHLKRNFFDPAEAMDDDEFAEYVRKFRASHSTMEIISFVIPKSLADELMRYLQREEEQSQEPDGNNE